MSELVDFSSVISKLKFSNKANVIFLAIQKSQEISSCDFYAFEKLDGIWHQVFETEGFVGKNGIKEPSARIEGDATTPAGVYSFGMLFGIKDAPDGLKKSYKILDDNDYWDADINSDTYNQYVKGSEMSSNWNMAASEHLVDYKESYNFAAEIEFNKKPVVKGKGSAIFLHCIRKGSTSSAGCVSIPEDKMLEALKLIDNSTFIVIVKNAEELIKHKKGF